ncbi:MAG: AAA family ATPase [Chloroflexota bacterium]|nr:AAA family ATPase [Chloroflexota bacterium]
MAPRPQRGRGGAVHAEPDGRAGRADPGARGPDRRREEQEEEVSVEAVRDATERLVGQVGQLVVGKARAIEEVFGALLVGGHVLLDDVPGVGKTTLARSIARSLDLDFHRIQCTPDLVPSDITGVSVFDQRSSTFEYRPGPVMANVVLVDEINRATPRAQSALLEAMQEGQVTVDEATHALPDPFFVIATQNPIELEGTFPLPEAQLDRFLLLLNLGYPSADEEDRVLRVHGPRQLGTDTLHPLFDRARIAELREAVRSVRIADAVRRYVVDVVRATRSAEGVELGASPRAALALFRATQALAAMRGRSYALPDDVKAQAPAVLRHRLFLDADAQMRGRTADTVIGEILSRVPVPAEEAVAAARP